MEVDAGQVIATPPKQGNTRLHRKPSSRRKRVVLPMHLKLAQYWRCDLLEKQCKEEMLNIGMLRPRTARQLLKIGACELCTVPRALPAACVTARKSFKVCA